MTKSHERNALMTAHAELIAVLGKGIQQFKDNLEYSKSHDVCQCIERFVDALYETAGGRDELQRMATLVETRCGPRSDYETARKESLRNYRGQPRKLTGSKIAVSKLRKSKGTPLFLAEVTEERREIERLLSEDILNFSAASRQAYESWRSACRAVQREAGLLKVDGCWHLFHLHESGDDRPSDRGRVARLVTETNLGGANLELVKVAADSLAAWAIENSPHKTEPKSVAKRRTTVNDSMVAEMASDLETVKGWTAQQWADRLGCGKSTVVETQTWKTLSFVRQQAKAEKRNDRRGTKPV